MELINYIGKQVIADTGVAKHEVTLSKLSKDSKLAKVTWTAKAKTT